MTRNNMVKPIGFLLMTSLVFAQTARTPIKTGAALAALTLKVNRNGVPIVAIENVKMFRYSDYFKEEIPDFRGVIKNVSGKKLSNVSVVGLVHKKDGTVVKFNVLDDFTDLPKGSVHQVASPFTQPWPFKPAEFDSVEFILEEQSCGPGLKPAAHGGCVYATRRMRQMADQKEKQTEADKLNAWNQGVADAKAAEAAEERAACTVIYRKTVDMKVKDLTVREERQVRACQALSLYPPQ